MVDSGERREGGALWWTAGRGGRVERCGGQWGEEGGWNAATEMCARSRKHERPSHDLVVYVR